MLEPEYTEWTLVVEQRMEFEVGCSEQQEGVEIVEALSREVVVVEEETVTEESGRLISMQL